MGSSGALGSSVTHHLQQSLGMRVLGADVMELPNDLDAGGFELDGFIQVEKDASLADLSVELVRGVDYCLRELEEEDNDNDPQNHDTLMGAGGVDAIICANGGWQGDPPPPTVVGGTMNSETLNEADEWKHRVEAGALDYATTITNMVQMNLNPCLAAAYVAQHFGNRESCLMVVMGATAALSPTPGMLGYGIAKAASHHLVQTVGACTGNSLESKSIRKAGRKTRQHLPALDDLTIVGILPTMIDTEANRRADPKGKFDQWTEPGSIAREIGAWIEQPALRPHSGSLVKVYRKEGSSVATFELAR